MCFVSNFPVRMFSRNVFFRHRLDGWLPPAGWVGVNDFHEDGSPAVTDVPVAGRGGNQ